MSVQITDSAGVLTPAQTAELQGISSPQRVKAIIENPSSKPELQAHVQACVDSPNTICIGVSPGLRYTWTEIGVDTGIASSDFQQVGRAGNADFKAAVGGDREGWSNGIKSIISRAQVLAHHETPTAVVRHEIQQTVVEHPVSATPFVVGFGLLGGVIGVVWYFVHRNQKRIQNALENAQRETAEMAARNIRAAEREEVATPRPAPSTAQYEHESMSPAAGRAATAARVRAMSNPPAYAPPTTVIVDRGSNNDFATGLLIGQAAAARERTPAPVYRRERTPTPSPRYRDDSSSSSSSSSSFDSFSGGGGGGSFDGGGGFSGGGGGGDF